MALKSGKQLCTKAGCRSWAMKNGSGFCFQHNLNLLERQKQRNQKQALARKRNSLQPEYLCAHPGCHGYIMKDNSGFCFMHNPHQLEKQQQRNKTQVLNRQKTAQMSQRLCHFPGCRSFKLRNSSDFCLAHAPDLAGKRRERAVKQALTRRTTLLTPDRRCSKPGCRAGAMHNDSSGLCKFHQPDSLQKLSERMKGNKLRLGRHMPWLGLENIEEARGLLFYSLETDQPLLTLRALTKIASLHHLGQMRMPKPLEAGKSLAEEYTAMLVSHQEKDL